MHVAAVFRVKRNYEHPIIARRANPSHFSLRWVNYDHTSYNTTTVWNRDVNKDIVNKNTSLDVNETFSFETKDTLTQSETFFEMSQTLQLVIC